MSFEEIKMEEDESFNEFYAKITAIEGMISLLLVLLLLVLLFLFLLLIMSNMKTMM